MKVERVAARAAAYGMPGVTVDGTDALEVRRAAREAVARARRGDGPTLLECQVRRWVGHYVGDAQKYRAPDDVMGARSVDPIQRLAGALAASGALAAGGLAAIEARVQAEVEAAVAFAGDSPAAAPEELFTDVYA